MKNEILSHHVNIPNMQRLGNQQQFVSENRTSIAHTTHQLPEILFITLFPPRECGIATYSQDLVKALTNKFEHSFKIDICALESDTEKHSYPASVHDTLNTDQPNAFVELANRINDNDHIAMVMIQHEFGFFVNVEDDFMHFIHTLNKPVVIVFHTVLPQPSHVLQLKVQEIATVADSIVVMTNSSANVLVNDYCVAAHKITVIPHGTHLLPHADTAQLKEKYHLTGKTIFSTFGLLSSGKSIETTLDALPALVKLYPSILFLIIGKTHPSVVKHEGEKYRKMLEAKIETLQLQPYVQFINEFVPLPKLLEYLQLTDIYLFTSKDPHQAVSGTFSYAMSAGCAIVSTPIPHAHEVLRDDAGIIVDFGDSEQLTQAVINLLSDEVLQKKISSKGLHRIAPTVWENAAIAHALLFEIIAEGDIKLHYKIPAINLDHLKRLTTPFAMIQFSIINQPDIDSGFTLDDNARAMVAMCQHFELTKDETDIEYITLYFKFIQYCLQPEGYFLNYVNEAGSFTEQNYQTNLADSNGRAIWALGYLISIADILPLNLVEEAKSTIKKALSNVNKIHSTRAMAFIIKGLYYANIRHSSVQDIALLKELANRLVQMYRHEADQDWAWYESYLTYANSILPEALLCAYLATGEIIYREIAESSFDFLLTKTFTKNSIKVISNKGWSHRGNESANVIGGEQPIDIAYTILALSKFYEEFRDVAYKQKMAIAFDWFLGNNHLHQIVYNPCTGGCYDGLEDNYINLNQGAESTVSYLMARLTVEKSQKNEQKLKRLRKHFFRSERQLELA